MSKIINIFNLSLLNVRSCNVGGSRRHCLRCSQKVLSGDFIDLSSFETDAFAMAQHGNEGHEELLIVSGGYLVFHIVDGMLKKGTVNYVILCQPW